MYAERQRTAARMRAEIDAQSARMADDEELLAEAETIAKAGMEASWEALPLAEADEDHASAVR